MGKENRRAILEGWSRWGEGQGKEKTNTDLLLWIEHLILLFNFHSHSVRQAWMIEWFAQDFYIIRWEALNLDLSDALTYAFLCIFFRKIKMISFHFKSNMWSIENWKLPKTVREIKLSRNNNWHFSVCAVNLLKYFFLLLWPKL